MDASCVSPISTNDSLYMRTLARKLTDKLSAGFRWPWRVRAIAPTVCCLDKWRQDSSAARTTSLLACLRGCILPFYSCSRSRPVITTRECDCGNTFGRVCLSLSPYVCLAVCLSCLGSNFLKFDQETSFFLHKYIRISQSSLEQRHQIYNERKNAHIWGLKDILVAVLQNVWPFAGT